MPAAVTISFAGYTTTFGPSTLKAMSKFKLPSGITRELVAKSNAVGCVASALLSDHAVSVSYVMAIDAAGLLGLPHAIAPRIAADNTLQTTPRRACGGRILMSTRTLEVGDGHCKPFASLDIPLSGSLASHVHANHSRPRRGRPPT